MQSSKFWADDASSSESEASSASEVEEQQQSAAKTTVAAARPAARWANIESSSDEEARRVVRSAKVKQWDVLRGFVTRLTNFKKNNDFTALSDEFDGLLKAMKKAQNLVEREGMPKFVIRCFVDLEDFTTDQIADREAFKKLTKKKATAINSMKAKVKKASEEFQIREQMESCREGPEKFVSSEESESGESSSSSAAASSSSSSSSSEDDDDDSSSDENEDDQKKKRAAPKPASSSSQAKAAAPQPLDEENEDDESDWGDDESSDSEESDDDSSSSSEEAADGTENDAAVVDFEDKHIRAIHKWGLKVKTPGDAAKASKASKPRVASKKKVKEISASVAGTPAADKSATEANSLLASFFASNQTIDADLLSKAVAEITAQRGKKSTDRSELIKALQVLVGTAANVGPQSILEILGHLISGHFDANLGAFNCLSAASWLDAYQNIERSLAITIAHPATSFLPATVSADQGRSSASAGGSTPQQTEERTASMLAIFLERLDDELIKSLQFADVHSEDYKERLRQSVELLALLWRALLHFQNRSHFALAASVALRILEHIYYKPDHLGDRMWTLVAKRLDPEDIATFPSCCSQGTTAQLNYLVQVVLDHGDSPRLRVRAVLHKVYNRALAGRYYQAKDLILSCNLQELASQSNVATHILYNRCIAQLGICAFRLGLIPEAHACLAEICQLNRHRELLAQGVSMSKNQEKTLEQEREEKRRQLPYHMHISLDLIEGVHNMCAMLLEVPNMAAHPLDHFQRVISRQFRRTLELHERQLFAGPPENPRETIVAATRALQKGDAAECCKHTFSLRIWEQMPDREKVEEILRLKIKGEALRTFIFSFSSIYNSYSVSQLSSIFELPERKVHAILSEMMVKEQLHASWDESSECIEVNKVQPTPLQVMCLKLADRVIQAVDQNELLLNFKNPRFVMQSEQRNAGRKFDDSRWGDRGDRQQRWQDRGGRDDRGGGYNRDYQNRGDYRGGGGGNFSRGPQPVQRGPGGPPRPMRPPSSHHSTGGNWGSEWGSHRSNWQSGQNLRA